MTRVLLLRMLRSRVKRSQQLIITIRTILCVQKQRPKSDMSRIIGLRQEKCLEVITGLT